MVKITQSVTPKLNLNIKRSHSVQLSTKHINEADLKRKRIHFRCVLGPFLNLGPQDVVQDSLNGISLGVRISCGDYQDTQGEYCPTGSSQVGDIESSFWLECSDLIDSDPALLRINQEIVLIAYWELGIAHFEFALL
ncbi:hypothetical protein ACB092_01G268500 [Castanea dentata]